MMGENKWILVMRPNGSLALKLGKVKFHSDLFNSWFKAEDRCIGGGKFHIDQENKEVILYGESVDYGQVPEAHYEDVLRLFESNWRYKDYKTFRLSKWADLSRILSDVPHHAPLTLNIQ